MNAKSLRTLALAAVAVVGISQVGCSTSHRKTQKEEATQQWNHTRAAVLCSLANDQYRSGNLDKCRETVVQALVMDPKNASLHLLSARVDIEQGRLESAEKSLRTAAEIDPNNPDVDYIRGVVLQRWQKPTEALACYRAAVEKKSDDIAYLLAEAEMLVVLDRRPEAMQLLQDRVVYFEHSGAIRDAIAQLLEQAGRFTEAVEYYRQAAILDSEDAGIRERLGTLLYRGGEYTEALTQLRRMAKTPEAAKRTDLKLMIAECVLQTGSASDARQIFDEVTTVNSTSVTAWLGVAKCSLRLSDVRRAELAAVKAVALQPELSQAQSMLGYVRVRQGKTDEAMVCFARAAAADREDAVSLSMIGMLLQKQGRDSEALAYFRRALAIDPHDELAVKLMASAANAAAGGSRTASVQ